MATYPTRGVEFVVPSLAAVACGQPYGINFNRRGHDYAVQYHRSGLAIERDGVQVRRWDDLPANVQAIIRKSKGMIPA